MNRHTATSSMAQAFPVYRQPPQVIACCALKRTGNAHSAGIVALWRIEIPVFV